MKILIPIVYIFFFVFNSNAQNVGVGTSTPTTNFEIKKSIKSTVKISSSSFYDTSQLIFSNRNSTNEGTDMQISNNRENGLRISSNSDLAVNKKDTIMQITPTGNVGIRTAAPQYPLDVKGDMNFTGELRTNGIAGESGQFLRSNGNGTMSWMSGGNSERFKNFRVYRYNGSGITTPYAFTFPSGVNEIAVEIWGGGGNGDEASAGSSYFTGGKSGAYIYAVIPVGTSTSMNLNVGSGSGCFSCGTTTNGNNSSVVLSGLLTLTAEGGSSNTFISLIARYSATGTYLPNVSYFGVEGSTGNWADIFYENSPSGYFVFHRNGKGADAPFRPNTGGKAGYMRTAYGTTSFTSIGGYPGSEPGGGGGFPTGSGGNGQVIVYW